MKITIKETVYKVKYSIRAIFIFEQLTGKVFKIEKLIDWYIFYYSMILANNPDCTLTFDNFVDECDASPNLVLELQEYLNNELLKQGQLSRAEDDSKKKQ